MKFYYVKTDKLTKKALVKYAEWFHNCGFDTVEYNDGGWADQMIRNVAPHLRFNSQQDATTFILANGGQYSEEIPMVLEESDFETSMVRLI
jgi:hypothetical protein